jgi:hypothetical protein
LTRMTVVSEEASASQLAAMSAESMANNPHWCADAQ